MDAPKPTVFVARRIPEVGLQAIAEVAQVRLHDRPLPPTRAELLAGVQGCAGLLTLLSDRVDAEVFDAAGPQLRVVSNFAVGNTPDVLTDATADIAVALMLAAARRLREGWESVADGRWQTWEPMGWIGQDLRGKTLGIVGMGRIGQAVARRLVLGWDMRLLYTARAAKPEVDSELGGRHVPLEQLLQESDFVSLHVSLSAQTRQLIGAEGLGRMKPTAVLVNTARGEVIDQAALVDALRSGKLFAAGLDVCDPEPLPLDSPLLQLSNCIVLPHIGSATVSARSAMAQRAAGNLIAGVQGKPLPFAVPLPPRP
ncbi:MAG: 2-hydroxyacid dehydrogenase [Aureliella sp.]